MRATSFDSKKVLGTSSWPEPVSSMYTNTDSFCRKSAAAADKTGPAARQPTPPRVVSPRRRPSPPRSPPRRLPSPEAEDERSRQRNLLEVCSVTAANLTST